MQRQENKNLGRLMVREGKKGRRRTVLVSEKDRAEFRASVGQQLPQLGAREIFSLEKELAKRYLCHRIAYQIIGDLLLSSLASTETSSLAEEEGRKRDSLSRILEGISPSHLGKPNDQTNFARYLAKCYQKEEKDPREPQKKAQTLLAESQIQNLETFCTNILSPTKLTKPANEQGGACEPEKKEPVRKCRNCHGVSFFPLSFNNRSIDEPMTDKMVCDKCGHSFKI